VQQKVGLIYLIRHGQTGWNAEKIFHGQADMPLDARGRRQAHVAGLELRQRGLVDPVFISSPLQRAYETAAIIAAAACGERIPVQTVEAFTDMHFGVWEGKSVEEASSLDPDLYRRWREMPAAVVFPGGSSLRQVADRAAAALQAIVCSNTNRDTVIVSHRVVNRLLLCHLLGAGPASFWAIRQDNACINLLAWDGDSFSVLLVNDTCHLRLLHDPDGEGKEMCK